MSEMVTQGAAAWTAEQMALITATIAKQATPDELKLFLYRAKNLGLDPLKPGQIHFVKYGNNPGTIVVGIEGFRVTAHRTGKLAGIKRGALRDEKGNLIGGWAEVYRTDWREPAREEVPLAEYNTGRGPWQKMPETMVKKVAEAAALRMAFPESLGGVYSEEEMHQAEQRPGQIIPEQPSAQDGAGVDRGYRIPFGKFAQRTLEEIDTRELGSYVDYIERKAEKDGKPLTGPVLDFVQRATAYLTALEAGASNEAHNAQDGSL